MRRNQKRGLPPLVVGLLVIGLTAIGTFLGFTKDNPFNDKWQLKAVFPSSNNLRPGSPVRVAGVNVGKVKAVEPSGGGRSASLVTLEFEERGLPIHKDAKVAVRPRIFLEGNFFVDVQPGSPSAPVLSDGDTLPMNQATAPVQIDQILTTLQSDTREDLKKLLKGLSTGLAGEGAAGYNRSQQYWEEAYRDGAIVADATRGERPRDLSEYLAASGRVAEALDRFPEELKSFVTDFNTTARAFAREDQALSAAIAELPRTLRAAQPALASLNRAFPPLRRLVADLRPAVRAGGPALDAQLPLVRELRGLVSPQELGRLSSDLRRVVPDLVELAEGGVEFQQQTRLLSSCQLAVIQPTANAKLDDEQFPPTGRVFEDGVKWLPGIAGESRSFDANGQYVKTLAKGGANFAYLLGNDRFFITSKPLLGVNPPARTKEPPLRPDVPCETQEPPDLRSKPGPAPQGRRISTSGPGYEARYKKALTRSLGWLEDQLKREGLDDDLEVLSTELKPEQLPLLRKGSGR